MATSGGTMPTVLAKMGVKRKARKQIYSITISYFLCKLTRRHTQETLKGGLQLIRRVGGRGLDVPTWKCLLEALGLKHL